MSDRARVPGAGRRAMRLAILVAAVAFGVALLLVAAVDRGARILGPALIVLGAGGGWYALRAWWRHLDEQRFLAEVALVALGWGLIASAYAGLQYLAFSFIGGAYRMDVDYSKLISGGISTTWRRDSARVAGQLQDVEAALDALAAGAPATLMVDSTYPLAGDRDAKVAIRCETPADCEWKLVLRRAGDQTAEVPISGPEVGAKVSRDELAHDLRRSSRQARREIAGYARRLADPAAHLEPRAVDFLYDTVIAFVGRDSGVFIAIGALPRIFRVLADLVSFMLFGIVVARASAATSARRGPAG